MSFPFAPMPSRLDFLMTPFASLRLATSRRGRALLGLGLVTVLIVTAWAAEPAAFQADLTKAEVGKLPEGMMVLSGDFTVREEGGKKFLELPGSPLESFGLLFGPPQPAEAEASGRFFGTKQGRKFPAFGLSLGGVSGYRLEMSGGKKALEISKGDELRKSVPFEWTSGSWTHLRLRVRPEGGGCVVEGKAWPEGTPEPAEWSITLAEPTPPPAGRAALWGAPYAGTPIRYDDLRVEAGGGK